MLCIKTETLRTVASQKILAEDQRSLFRFKAELYSNPNQIKPTTERRKCATRLTTKIFDFLPSQTLTVSISVCVSVRVNPVSVPVVAVVVVFGPVFTLQVLLVIAAVAGGRSYFSVSAADAAIAILPVLFPAVRILLFRLLLRERQENVN